MDCLKYSRAKTSKAALLAGMSKIITLQQWVIVGVAAAQGEALVGQVASRSAPWVRRQR
jgi:hypothetical protein